MGQSLLSPASIPLKLKLPTIPTSFSPTPTPKISPLRRNLQTKALLFETKYPKVAAQSTGPIPAAELLRVVESAAEAGAEVVMEAVNKPRNINYKGVTDLVTDTDKMSESVILDVVKKNFKDHLILGEEGGLIGDTSSDYLWCIDPLDGTTNFAHCYPSFAVSVGVLFRGKPAAASVVEFVGGPMCWDTRTFSASSCGGAFCNGQKIHVSQTEQVERSLLVTGFGYEHDDAWVTNINLFKEFTDISRGVRRLGAAAVDMSHVALGIVEAYWEYRLKPWDMAAGVLIVEEAGGVVTRMDGGSFSVFDRSVLVSNGIVHDKVKNIIETNYFPRYLTKKEAGTYILLDDGKPPAFTETVWEEMESQNGDFFRAYKIRVALKNQIARFNALLVSQSLVLMAPNNVASRSLPNADPSCSTSAQVSNPNNIQHSMFPSTSCMYHPPSESRRIPVANSGIVCAQMIDPSSGAMHHPRMNGPNFFPNGHVRAPGMNTPTGLMQQHRMSSVGHAPEPNMPTGGLTHPNRMNMPSRLMQHMTNGRICGSSMNIPTRMMQQPMMNGVVRAPGMNAPAGPMQYRMNSLVSDKEADFVNPRMDPSTRVPNGVSIGPGMYSPAPAPMYTASPYRQAMSSPYDLTVHDDQNQLLFNLSERTHHDMIERCDPPPEALSFSFPRSTAMDINGMFYGNFHARMMNGPPNGDFSERMKNGPAPNNSNSSSLNNSIGRSSKGP